MTTQIDRRSSDRGLRNAEASPRGSNVRDLRGVRGAIRTGYDPTPVMADEPADGALEASAGDLRALFEEAAAELLRRTATAEATGPACRWETISLRAPDLAGLAGLWLDRLIALSDSRLGDERREAIVVVVVDRIAPPDEDPQCARWQLRARVGLRPYRETSEQRLPEVRSASDRPLAVEGAAGSWTLRASLAY